MDEETRSRVTLRRILALAVGQWKVLAVGTVFLFIGSTMGLLYPQAIRVLVDEALTSGRTDLVDMAAVIMVVVFGIAAISTGIRYALFTIAGERIVANLRSKLYGRIVRQEIGFFDERRTGELVNRLSSDTTVLQNTVSSNVSMALRSAASVIGGIGFLFFTSPRLTVLMLAVVPPVALGAVFYGRKLRKISREVQDALADASHVAEESIGSIRTVRSFAAENGEVERYDEAIETSFELSKKRSILAAIFMAVTSFAGFAAGALVLWYGGHLVIDGMLSIGELTAFLVYTMIVAFSLAALSGLYADFMKASGASERVFELMDRRSELTPGTQTIDEVRGDVVFENVKFAYPTRTDIPVFEKLDLRLSPGQVVALVGPSGAGKSTVAALLARFYDPIEGTIELDGKDLRELDGDWLRLQIGTVAQEPVLFSSSITDNIRYSRPDATDEEIEAAARAANAHDFIEAFPDGYATAVGERGVQLSGGQKQRVAIARAVLKDPTILILDEATSALDAESEHLVKDALDRLMRGRTTLVIAHRLSTVADADEVVVLEGGRVVQSGSHQSLMDQGGLYRRLVERQFVAA